jgi:MoaA/NifB/PqqE/SkfB family radical SAM enzyme
MTSSAKGQKLALAMRWAGCLLRRQPLRHMTIEVTKRCNARCSFCPYWEEPRGRELADYSPIVGQFKPLVVTLSGGEPLVRRDLFDIVGGIRSTDPRVYIAVVTNGSLLTVEMAKQLRRQGLNQLSISLDYADRRHDEVRGVPGLYERVVGLLPGLAGLGFDSVSLNTVIKNDNLDSIGEILELARANGVMVGFSAYCSLKTGNEELMVRESKSLELERVIELIKEYKGRYGITRTSNYYLDNVSSYFEDREIRGCQAGRSWFQVTPSGEVKPCSELPVVESDYRKYDPKSARPVSCTACWYSCRGESQAPVTLERVRGLI